MDEELFNYTEKVGERIQEWVEESLTIENGCKRNQEEGDTFERKMMWVFTQKGQRLYESYLSKAQMLIEKKYPEKAEYYDLDVFTGVVYP